MSITVKHDVNNLIQSTLVNATSADMQIVPLSQDEDMTSTYKVGKVTSVLDNSFYEVIIDNKKVKANVATSLMLRPIVGDVVGCRVVNNIHFYISEILESTDDNSSRNIVLPNRVSLLSSGELAILASKLVMNALNLEQHADNYMNLSRRSEFHTERKIDQSSVTEERTKIKSLNAEQVKEKVTGVVTQHVGTLTQTVDNALNTKAQSLRMIAEQRVDIDGEKINLG